MLASAPTLPNHYRPNNHYRRWLSGYLYICIAVLNAKHVTTSFLCHAAIVEVEKFVTFFPPHYASTAFVEGVNCASFRSQFLDCFEHANSTQRFCILLLVNTQIGNQNIKSLMRKSAIWNAPKVCIPLC